MGVTSMSLHAPQVEGLVALGLQMRKLTSPMPLRPAWGPLSCLRAVGFKLPIFPAQRLSLERISSLRILQGREAWPPVGAKPYGYQVLFFRTCCSVGLDFCHLCPLPQPFGISFS